MIGHVRGVTVIWPLATERRSWSVHRHGLSGGPGKHHVRISAVYQAGEKLEHEPEEFYETEEMRFGTQTVAAAEGDLSQADRTWAAARQLLNDPQKAPRVASGRLSGRHSVWQNQGKKEVVGHQTGTRVPGRASPPRLPRQHGPAEHGRESGNSNGSSSNSAPSSNRHLRCLMSRAPYKAVDCLGRTRGQWPRRWRENRKILSDRL